MWFCIFCIYSFLLYCCTSIDQYKSALCFLTRTPSVQTLEFARDLANDTINYNVDIFIIVDDNNFDPSNISTSSNLRLIQISNYETRNHGYHKTISLGPNYREITSWDKALYYFIVRNRNYSFLWLVEDDVFIPSVQAFRSLHQLYALTNDLVVPKHVINVFGDTKSWLWSMEVGLFVPPWASTMVNVVGLSKRMLLAIDDYVAWRGQVPFHEFFFNTLAMKLNFKIVIPTELSTIVFSSRYSLKQILRRPNNMWHPVKDFNLHTQWRNAVLNQSLNVKHSLDFTNLGMLCLTEQKTIDIWRRLNKLLENFQIAQCQLKPHERILLREHFTRMTEQCVKRNVSDFILQLLNDLTQHAYKLPEPSIKDILTNKSKVHLKLEEELAENKKQISLLPVDSEIVKQLRKQAFRLTETLTEEVLREYAEMNRSQNEIKNTPAPPKILYAPKPIISVGKINMSNTTLTSNNTVLKRISQRFSFVLNRKRYDSLNFISNYQITFCSMSLLLCALFYFIFRKNSSSSMRRTISIAIFILTIYVSSEIFIQETI